MHIVDVKLKEAKKNYEDKLKAKKELFEVYKACMKEIENIDMQISDANFDEDYDRVQELLKKYREMKKEEIRILREKDNFRNIFWEWKEEQVNILKHG